MSESGVRLSSNAEAAAAGLKNAASAFEAATRQLVADLNGTPIAAGGDVGARLAAALEQTRPLLDAAQTGTANAAEAGAFGEVAVEQLREVDRRASLHLRT